MLLARHRIHLVFQHAQGADHARAGLARLDDIVHVSALGGDERVGEALAEFVDLLPARGGLIDSAVMRLADVVFAFPAPAGEGAKMADAS